MIRGLVRALVLVVLGSVPLRAEELLHNASFEKGSDASITFWRTSSPPFQPPPEFTNPRSEGKDGRRCAAITVRFGGGYTSLNQILSPPPRSARTFQLEGWIKTRELEPGKFGYADLMIYFRGARTVESTYQQTNRVKGNQDWTWVSVRGVVPEWAREWTIRCGLVGPGRALYDDLRLTVSEEIGRWAPVELGVASASFTISAGEADVERPWIRFSVPLPFEGQTPLAVRVRSSPPRRITRLSVVRDRENRPLQVDLEPMRKGGHVGIFVETYVMVCDVMRCDVMRGGGERSDGTRIRLAGVDEIPEEVRIHLEPAAGVAPDHPPIAKAAKRFSRRDLGSMVKDLFAFLDERIEAGSGPQGAVTVLERGTAACTGCANLAASLLIAAKVPTRLLACVLVGVQQQEHSIVEAWTPELGWSRIESTSKLFPLEDSRHFILRVVYPDSPRSAGAVPLYLEASDGTTAGFLSSWQEGRMLATHLVEPEELDRLTATARAAFEAMADEAVAGDRAVLLPIAPAAGARRTAQALLDDLSDRLKKP